MHEIDTQAFLQDATKVGETAGQDGRLVAQSLQRTNEMLGTLERRAMNNIDSGPGIPEPFSGPILSPLPGGHGQDL